MIIRRTLTRRIAISISRNTPIITSITRTLDIDITLTHIIITTITSDIIRRQLRMLVALLMLLLTPQLQIISS